jgi:hypothetical protein
VSSIHRSRLDPVGDSKTRRPGPVNVRFTPEEVRFYRLLAARAAARDRSISNQLKHYLRVALIAEDNPDLPLSMIHGILEGQAELKAGLAEPYAWGVREPVTVDADATG